MGGDEVSGLRGLKVGARVRATMAITYLSDGREVNEGATGVVAQRSGRPYRNVREARIAAGELPSVFYGFAPIVWDAAAGAAAPYDTSIDALEEIDPADMGEPERGHEREGGGRVGRRTAERIAVIAAILETAADERHVAATLVTLARKIALGQHVATFRREAAPNALRDELEGLLRHRRFVKRRGRRRVRGFALGERVVILAPTHAGERGHVTCTTASDNVPLLVQLDGGGGPVPFLAHEIEKETSGRGYPDGDYFAIGEPVWIISAGKTAEVVGHDWRPPTYGTIDRYQVRVNGEEECVWYPRVDVVAKPYAFPTGQRVRWGDRLGTVQSDRGGVIAVLFDCAWPGEREGSVVACHRSELELAPGTAPIAEVKS